MVRPRIEPGVTAVGACHGVKHMPAGNMSAGSVKFCGPGQWRSSLWAAALVLAAAAPPDAGQRMNAAFNAAQTLARQDRAQGKAPTVDDPRERPVLEQLWDAPALLGHPPYTAADAPLLLTIVNVQVQIIGFYLNFSPDPAHQADAARNMVLFQDEIVRSLAFAAQAAAGSVAALTDAAARMTQEQLDRARPGTAQLRAGTQQFAVRWASLVSDPQLHQDNRERLLASMASTGPALASGLTLPQREAMRRAVQPGIDRLPATQRPQLAGVISALASQQCDGFCRVP